MASVPFDHVSKRFSGGTVAVKGLSLEVKATELMVRVGPSGCGKSTWLRMLAGLEEISDGEIRIGDRVVNDVPPRDRDIAMVFQSYALYPHMTVFDNLAFGLRMRGTPREDIDRRVKQAAEILELGPLLNRKPRQLSGGQRQRVALGRAIVREPQAFLLDEPLSNLDAKLRVQTRIELQKQHRALHATFIYVTHDQVEAMTMGDRIAVMRDGVLQQVAPPREIYDHPANMYVAGFIGSPTMNFIPVTIQGSTAKASGFEVQLPTAPGVATAASTRREWNGWWATSWRAASRACFRSARPGSARRWTRARAGRCSPRSSRPTPGACRSSAVWRRPTSPQPSSRSRRLRRLARTPRW